MAEELAQEALARTWERWSTVSRMASPEAWTYRTAMNLARSQFRRRAAERRANRRHALRPPTGEAWGADSPDAAASLAVRDAVAQLPPRQRAVIVARFYLGLDVADAADALGCAPGTVKAATHAALQNLRAAGLIDSHPLDPEVDRT